MFAVVARGVCRVSAGRVLRQLDGLRWCLAVGSEVNPLKVNNFVRRDQQNGQLRQRNIWS